MRILCDLCGAEIRTDTAVFVADEERVHFFCSQVCAAECGFYESASDPGLDEDASPP